MLAVEKLLYMVEGLINLRLLLILNRLLFQATFFLQFSTELDS